MAVFSKQFLSGSTEGRPKIVVATATPGTLIHTSVSGSSNFDEIWLYAVNTSSSAVKLTIQFGGITVPDHIIEVSIGGETGLVLVVPGVPLNNGNVVRAFAAVASVINIIGWVNRIS